MRYAAYRYLIIIIIVPRKYDEAVPIIIPSGRSNKEVYAV